MNDADVLVVGAGPTGLTLGCALARSGATVRVIDAATEPFSGSRGKGLQPRTLEIFDQLDLADAVLAEGAAYPKFRVHLGPLVFTVAGLAKHVEPSDGVPFPNLWMLPQWRTESLLRARFESLGGKVEWGVKLTGFEQTPTGVDAHTERGTISCRYLVGADGGHSVVRKMLGFGLVGESLEGERVVVADVELDGLDRSRWHVWPLAKGGAVTLCPLPGTSRFQLAIALKPGVEAPTLDFDSLRAFVEQRTKQRVTALTWSSLYRPQVRMVERYRSGRVFLAGDAAHVHPPAGGQGLNTGVQDAWNLGWKLAEVLHGAPDSLLDTYEAERLPIAAQVLGLSKRLHQTTSRTRGSDTQQLGLHYRDSPLSVGEPGVSSTLQPGDRAPDVGGRRLFRALRRPGFTVLAFGSATYPGALRFDDETAWRVYGLRDGLVQIRPDGYIAAITRSAHVILCGAAHPSEMPNRWRSRKKSSDTAN